MHKIVESFPGAYHRWDCLSIGVQSLVFILQVQEINISKEKEHWSLVQLSIDVLKIMLNYCFPLTTTTDVHVNKVGNSHWRSLEDSLGIARRTNTGEHMSVCLSAVVCLIAELGWFFYSSVNYRWLKGWKLQTVLVKVTTQVDEPATGEESNFCHPVSTIILLTSPYQNRYVCHIFWYLRLSAVKIDDQTDQSLFWQIYLGTWTGEHSQI